MGRGISFGGSNMNNEYWERYKEYRMAGLSPEQSMIKAHEAMIGIV